MFNRFLHPCGVTDVLVDVMIGVGVEIFSNMEMFLMGITLQLMMGVTQVGDVRIDVLTDLLAVLVIDVVTTIDVDMLADENENGLAAVMTPLEFTLSAP